MIFFCRGLFDVSGLNHKHFLAEVCWEFSEFEISCSTSPPGGNQVDGLPPAFSMDPAWVSIVLSGPFSEINR